MPMSLVGQPGAVPDSEGCSAPLGITTAREAFRARGQKVSGYEIVVPVIVD
jgi:hypothetical protein